ncbi:hypothetical protein, partial [Enterobacter ludwigii]|uniref:hypothetical protein n=1 Tax=Enterobacter ludwigii TaxID=299767 RepID=UPI000AB22717
DSGAGVAASVGTGDTGNGFGTTGQHFIIQHIDGAGGNLSPVYMRVDIVFDFPIATLIPQLAVLASGTESVARIACTN